MSLFILIAGLFLLFWFRNAIRKTASLAENTVTTVIDTSDDSLQTYAADINISNAKKRNDQLVEINKIDKIVTNDEIKDLLAKKTKTEA